MAGLGHADGQWPDLSGAPRESPRACGVGRRGRGRNGMGAARLGDGMRAFLPALCGVSRVPVARAAACSGGANVVWTFRSQRQKGGVR